jgi:excisionase family DNA binding protein
LTSAEAARLIGVGPTAIKRWADSGMVPCVKTAGGHRRFRRSDIERLRHQGQAEAPEGWDAWLDLLVSPTDGHLVQARLLDERARAGSWHGVAARLGGLLTEMGRRWQAGRLTVLDEHLASGRLQRALAAVSDSLPVSAQAPSALLASIEGDEHTVGLSLVEVTLREAGWRTEWAGSRTPVRDIAARVERGDLGMVAVSASAWSADAGALSQAVDVLGPACRDAGVTLVMGGAGAWPEPPVHGHQFTDLEAFFAFAREARAA